MKVVVPFPKKGLLVARLRGVDSSDPVLLLGHLDVVEARREDWTIEPFQFVEKDGFFYGRGTQDMKGDVAMMVANLIRLRQENWKPPHDMILVLTSDEEGGQHNGVKWLLANQRALIDAAYCLNLDAGGGAIRNGKTLFYGLEASEKVYQDFWLEVKNKGGHSSLPVKDNAIYHLARGLARLADFNFPAPAQRGDALYFERMSAVVGGREGVDMKAALNSPPDKDALERLSATPFYNAQLRTTCVATMLEGGHARNALPQLAKVNLNCRMLPDDTIENVRQTLETVVADPEISVSVREPGTGAPASPLKARDFRGYRKNGSPRCGPVSR